MINRIFPGNLPTVETVPALKGLPSYILTDRTVYLVLNRDIAGDGLGAVWNFRPASLEPDDGVRTIIPSDLRPGQRGRWHVVIESAGGAVPSFMGTFEDVVKTDVPDGINVIFVSGDRRGELVADETMTDADVAAQPRLITKSKNGRIFRYREDQVNLRQVGLKFAERSDAAAFATAVEYNTGAFNEALAYLMRFGTDTIDNSNGKLIYHGGPRLTLPALRFPMGRIHLKQTILIEGEGYGLEGGKGTTMDFSTDGGIWVEQFNTFNGERVPNGTGGDGSILRGFTMYGGQNAVSRNANPGINLKARATLEKLFIEGFAGAGIRVVASATDVGERYGNANLFAIYDCSTYFCFDGLYILGADVNAGKTVGFNPNFAASCGIKDDSFLGNSHIGAHSSFNGRGANGVTVMVTRNGIRYTPMQGRETLWSTTTPGTDSSVWRAFEEGGVIPNYIPEWYSGIPVMFGAAYSTSNRNARSVFESCYTEGTQAPPQIQWPSLAIGGLLFPVGDAIWINGEQGVLNAANFRSGGAFLEGGAGALGVDGPQVPGFRIRPTPTGDVRFDFANADGLRAMKINGPATTDPRGPRTVAFDYFIGVYGNGTIGGFEAAKPGSNLPFYCIVWNANRTSETQPMGWSNVPGTTTWLAFGA